jgi:hypothetical protein
MGNVGINYTHGNLWVCRAYVKGFTVQSGVTNLHWTGTVLDFEYTPAALKWELQLNLNFYAPTSNMYSLDHVFDLANSYSFVGIIPTPTTINFGLMFIPGEGSFRLGTEPSLPGDPAQHVELPLVPDYWLPI